MDAGFIALCVSCNVANAVEQLNWHRTHRTKTEQTLRISMETYEKAGDTLSLVVGLADDARSPTYVYVARQRQTGRSALCA